MIKRSYGIMFVYIITLTWIVIGMMGLVWNAIDLHHLHYLSADDPSFRFRDVFIRDSEAMIVAFIGFLMPPVAIVFAVWWSEHRRQRIMKGSFASHYLAVQPQSDAEALPLPTTIDVRVQT